MWAPTFEARSVLSVDKARTVKKRDVLVVQPHVFVGGEPSTDGRVHRRVCIGGRDGRVDGGTAGKPASRVTRPCIRCGSWTASRTTKGALPYDLPQRVHRRVRRFDSVGITLRSSSWRISLVGDCPRIERDGRGTAVARWDSSGLLGVDGVATLATAGPLACTAVATELHFRRDPVVHRLGGRRVPGVRRSSRRLRGLERVNWTSTVVGRRTLTGTPVALVRDVRDERMKFAQTGFPQLSIVTATWTCVVRIGTDDHPSASSVPRRSLRAGDQGLASLGLRPQAGAGRTDSDGHRRRLAIGQQALTHSDGPFGQTG